MKNILEVLKENSSVVKKVLVVGAIVVGAKLVSMAFSTSKDTDEDDEYGYFEAIDEVEAEVMEPAE